MEIVNSSKEDRFTRLSIMRHVLSQLKIEFIQSLLNFHHFKVDPTYESLYERKYICEWSISLGRCLLHTVFIN